MLVITLKYVEWIFRTYIHVYSCTHRSLDLFLPNWTLGLSGEAIPDHYCGLVLLGRLPLSWGAIIGAADSLVTAIANME